MRWHLTVVAAAIVLVLLAVLAAPKLADAAGVTTPMNGPILAPTLTNLRVYSSPSDCAQNPGMPNCTSALAGGLQLFVWSCTGCPAGWPTIFVVNGQASPASDINLAPSRLLALTVRKSQFKSGDCVAVRVYNPGGPSQNATSNAVCSVSAAGSLSATKPSQSGASGPVLPGGTTVVTGPPHGATNATLNKGVVLSNLVPVPTGMGITHDTPTCTAHGGIGGGFACTAGLQAGFLALVWNCQGCKVDGYRLYRVDGGRHDAIPSSGAYANDATVTLALIDPQGANLNGRCYAITAYKGSNESTLSNWACAGAGSVATTVTLQPTHTLHWKHSRDSRTIGWTHDPTDAYDSKLYVGYGDHYGPDLLGDYYSDEFDRSGMVFDLSSLAGHPISKAVLKLSALSSWHDYNNTDWQHPWYLSALSPEACVAVVDLATDRWWQNNDLNSSVSYLSSGGYMGPDFSIDVTTAISNWMGYQSSSDFGFVLRGDDENDLWHGNTNHVCMTQLQSVSLVVTYY
jgi:hypothetical protein